MGLYFYGEIMSITSNSPIYYLEKILNELKLAAGDGINEAPVDGELYGRKSGEWSLISQSDSVIPVNNLSDLPEPIGGVITLQNGKLYSINADINLGANRIALNGGKGAIVGGGGTSISSLTYTGTLPMITAIDTDIFIENLAVTCQTSTVVDISETTPGTSSLSMRGLTVYACDKFARAEQIYITFITRCVIVGVASSPAIQFVGANNFAQINDCLFSSYTGTLLDLGTSTFNTFKVSDCQVNNPAGGITLSGLANSGNINTGGAGAYTSNLSSGEMPQLSGVSQKDGRWIINNNNNLTSSATRGMLYFTGNTDQTVISNADEYTDIDNGAAPPTFTLDGTSERVSSPANGVLQIDTATPLNTRAQANVSLRSTVGGQERELYVAIFESADDGSVYTQVQGIESNGNIGTEGGVIVVSAPFTTQEGYRYKVRVKNIDDSANVLVTSVQFYLG